MSSVWSFIRFEYDGSSVLLYNDEECREAVKKGVLKPDTQIELTVDQKRYWLPAKEAGAYGLCFEVESKTDTVADDIIIEDEQNKTIDINSAPSIFDFSSPDVLESENIKTSNVVTSYDNLILLPDSTKISAQQTYLNKRAILFKFLLATLAASAAVAWLLSSASPSVKLWTARAAPVHREAGGDPIPGRLIRRGEPVIVFKTGGEWAELAHGDDKFGFLRSTYLASAKPPSLDVNGGGMMKSIRSVVVLDKPSDDGSRIQFVKSGAHLNANGLVLPSREWLEVLIAGGGVGYIRRSDVAAVDSSTSKPDQQSATISRNKNGDQGSKLVSSNAKPAIETKRPPQTDASLADDSLANTSIDDESAPGVAVSAIPTRDPSTWINPNDYPFSSAANGEEGIVEFELHVSDNGRVARCDIVSSSGYSNLDRTTCRLIKTRARFRQTYSLGAKSPSAVYSGAYEWILP